MKAWDLKARFETKNIKAFNFDSSYFNFFYNTISSFVIFKLLNKEFLHDSISKSKIYRN